MERIDTAIAILTRLEVQQSLLRDAVDELKGEIREDRMTTTLLSRDVDELKQRVTTMESTLMGHGKQLGTLVTYRVMTRRQQAGALALLTTAGAFVLKAIEWATSHLVVTK